ncbi:thiopurine S-methyltransferase [Aliiglaciecola sp. CAU 1673]|uniref:thiopurine S-methyltransferase n=1 Tax=Aliiglaciecola sp. CAU 1673 TaxID=3032595 RepID=UPI0023DBFCDC|nr:thiopurine S-methyltransferase [Aliiglaciecola sp. CAU 1673]MDF2179162.1 thiopurine S-methyltransferase [Aliiglaciecola sp. CAU 1673]
MDASFWHQRWASNEIGFHGSEANPMLVEHFSSLNLNKGERIFLPLCGKTLDITWLLAQDLKVVGAELSEIAIQQLFAELGVTPTISEWSKGKHYRAENLDIYVGDFFAMQAQTLGHVDAIYDRAAMVALPESMRLQYTTHLMALTARAPMLLISFEYDQRLMPGPPFSVTEKEITAHYQPNYQLQQLAAKEVPGGLKGKCPARECVWLLASK